MRGAGVVVAWAAAGSLLGASAGNGAAGRDGPHVGEAPEVDRRQHPFDPPVRGATLRRDGAVAVAGIGGSHRAHRLSGRKRPVGGPGVHVAGVAQDPSAFREK